MLSYLFIKNRNITSIIFEIVFTFEYHPCRLAQLDVKSQGPALFTSTLILPSCF